MVTADFAALEALLPPTFINTLGQYNAFGPSCAEDFDDLDDSEMDALPLLPAAGGSDFIPIEDRHLPLPSHHNSQHPFAPIELQLRLQQADELLDSLRTSIADKSFQYTHVIRVAPRKSVQTRARSVIAKLNQKICLYSMAYRRCRSSVLRLSACPTILNKYKELDRADVKASSALVDPNKPGASSVRLSWIWQNTTHSASSSSPHLRECEYVLGESHNCLIFTISSSTCSLAACPSSEKPMVGGIYSHSV